MNAQDLHFHDYWRIIYRRRYVLLIIFIGVLSASLIFSFLKTPVYQTFTRLQISISQQTNIPGIGLQMGYVDPWSLIETEVQAIASLSIAEKAAERLHITNEKDTPQEKILAASKLLGMIKVEREGNSNIVRIFASGHSPKEIADLANEFALAYIEHQTEQKLETARETTRFLEARLVESERKLAESENTLKKFKEKFGETGTSDSIALKISALNIQKNNFQKKYTSRHPELIKINTQIDYYNEKLKKLPAQELALSELKRNVRLNESEYINLSDKFKKSQISEANTTQNIFLISRASMPAIPVSPNHKINGVAGALLGIIIGLVFVFIFENLDTSIGTIEEVEEYMGLPVLGVIPHIDLPHTMEISLWKRLTNYFFRNKKKKLPTDKRTLIIYHSKKSHFAESYHTLRTNIKFTALGAHGKTLLFTSAGTDEGKTITSANFCIAAATVGIKTLLIEADLRRPTISGLFGLSRREGLTDLILGNAAWPAPVYGISDFLLGELGVENLLSNPAIENLKILPAGSIHANPVDILSSPEFDHTLEKLKDEFDLIVFDCSPVLLFADSIILGKKVEAVVLIYQVGKMARGALKRAKAQLEGLKASIKGVVLNDLRTADMGPQYGYYYYNSNYYKYYATDDEKSKKRKSVVL